MAERDAPAGGTWPRFRALTPARIGLARAGAAVATPDHLRFQLAHARARDAVHDRLDAAPLLDALRLRGIDARHLASAAGDRETYLLRPDLGRRLDDRSCAALAGIDAGCDVGLVLADGLSARAVARHALPLVDRVLPEFARRGWRLGPIALVEQGRVAIGDDIGHRLGAALAIVLIGERPGLSAPDSLGAYITWAPAPGRSDAERNCISNIHAGGLSYDEAASRLLFIAMEARRRRLTGVALKDETTLAGGDVVPTALP